MMKPFSYLWSAITSRRAAQGVINVSILATSYTITLVISAIATAIFQLNYVPDATLTWPLYLQYGLTSHPFSVVSTGDKLPITHQDYDVSVSLSLPMSPRNMDLGNFMIETIILSVTSTPDTGDVMSAFHDVPVTPTTLAHSVSPESLILRSRRPTLVPYRDPVVAAIRRFIMLPFYVITGDSSKLTIETPVAENINFSDSTRLPKLIFVEIQAGQSIQIYSAIVKLEAKMAGLRYFMYHYRAISYLVLTGLFWASSLAFTTCTWIVWVAVSGMNCNNNDTVHIQQSSGKGNNSMVSNTLSSTCLVKSEDFYISPLNHGNDLVIKTEDSDAHGNRDMHDSLDLSEQKSCYQRNGSDLALPPFLDKLSRSYLNMDDADSLPQSTTGSAMTGFKHTLRKRSSHSQK